MSNLEPIEEKDLNIEGKFKGEKKETPQPEAEKEIFKIEKETPPETNPAEKEGAYGKILSKIKQLGQPVLGEEEIKSDAESVFQKNDAQSQIQHLVDIALQKGVVHAVKVASHLENNYVLDMFHDKLLADELHKALTEKGLIKDL
ncbi:MAG: hypothetical protein NT136_01300 [Candidatus Moranbacteria bacterium]|nr:hypothetical protein [Candidatus Moranbacteria bacterium]